MTTPAARPHTGRQRNEAARDAILRAARRQFGERPAADVTVATIATEAGVGRQTIYRWWPTKYAILLEAMTELGRTTVEQPDTGTYPGDLEAFITATFNAARDTTTSALLRVLMAEAQRDPDVHRMLREFTDRRRQALRDLLDRAAANGELDTPADLLIDQVFGVLWYRILLDNGPLTPTAATELTRALLNQTQPRPPTPKP